jgi:hypothetical protein
VSANGLDERAGPAVELRVFEQVFDSEGDSMTTYTVTGVRRETSADGTHTHVEGVCTDAGEHRTREQVVESIMAGNVWQTAAHGYAVTITTMSFCPAPKCLASPYLRTDPDSTTLDNLENLPDC